jgi:hypothetical protein
MGIIFDNSDCLDMVGRAGDRILVSRLEIKYEFCGGGWM